MIARPIAAALLAVTAPTFAADLALGVPVPIGAGARALGMGGAFSAVADDATANTWNPGGMVQLERPEVAATVGAYRRAARVAGAADTSADAIALDHLSAILPFHAGFEQTVGIAWQRQFDLAHERREPFTTSEDLGFGPIVTTHDSHVDETGSLACLSASWAAELAPGLGFGVTLAAWNDDLTGASHARTRTHSTSRVVAPFPISSDTTTTDDARDDYVVRDGYSATIGGWWRATPWLSVGAVVKPEYRLRLGEHHHQDEVVVDNSSGIATPTPPIASHDRLALTYPTSATLGGALRVGDLTTIALDGTWTQWSRYRVSDTPPGGTTLTRSPIDGIHHPGDFHDGWTARLGIERFVVLETVGLGLRVGALWQQVPGLSRAAAPDAATVAETGTTRDTYVGATAGVGAYLRRLIVDVGVEARRGRGVATGQDAAADQRADVTIVIGRVGVAWMF